MPTLSLAAPLAAAPCDDGEQVCDLVYDWTGSARFADWADVLIGTPLAILGLIIFGFVVRWVLNTIVERIARRAEKGVMPERLDAAAIARRSQRAETMAGIFQSVITVIVIAVVATMILSEIGVNIAPIIASAGIIGIALGFGAQSLVKDFLSGVFIFMEDQYGVGDVIDTGTVVGTVEEVTLRITRLRDGDGVVWYIRNGEILRLGNRSQGWSVAVVDVQLAYTDDIVRVTGIMTAAVEDLAEHEDWSDVLMEKPHVTGIEAMTQGLVTLRVTAQVRANERDGVQREIRSRLKAAFDANDVHMPLPLTGPVG